MSKQVGRVSGKQFGHLFIGGVPYNPSKVKRFVGKGVGIKIGDIVVFEADDDRVLSYIKNSLYVDSAQEKHMVREFVKATELAKVQPNLDGVSDQIRKDLAEEGITITNDGEFTNIEVAASLKDTDAKVEAGKSVSPVEVMEANLHPELFKYLTEPDKRQLSIIIQSSLKLVTDVTIVNTPDGEKVDYNQIKLDALAMAMWVDKNSTRIFQSPFILKKLAESQILEEAKK